jgi:DNA-binding phage protein
MKLPRDLGGEELAVLLRRSAILNDVAQHLGMAREALVKSLWEK